MIKKKIKPAVKNYYHDGKRVWTISESIDMSQKPQYTALTDEQRMFYLQCKEDGYQPTLSEVLNAAKHVVPEPPEISLKNYKAMKVYDMSYQSLSVAERKYPEYQRTNAILGVYPAEKTEEMKTYFAAMRGEFYRLKTEIEAAESKEDIDNIVLTAQFDSL